MKDIYKQVWHLFDGLTPIPADCGKLCGRRCCKGGNEAGMILFPGERKLMSPDFTLSTRKMGDLDVDFAVCKGRCRRKDRPLSCRIFPFAPFYENGTLTIRPDSRASYQCPLLLPEAAEYMDPDFIKAVEEAFHLLLTCEGFDRFLYAYTQMLDGYKRFTQ